MLIKPSNSIWNDQTLAVNLANNVLNGKFPLVGHLHSNRMTHSPTFYYLVVPFKIFKTIQYYSSFSLKNS